MSTARVVEGYLKSWSGDCICDGELRVNYDIEVEWFASTFSMRLFIRYPFVMMVVDRRERSQSSYKQG
jgi:hypothetical protein